MSAPLSAGPVDPRLGGGYRYMGGHMEEDDVAGLEFGAFRRKRSSGGMGPVAMWVMYVLGFLFFILAIAFFIWYWIKGPVSRRRDCDR
jgi:hypothetical protein